MPFLAAQMKVCFKSELLSMVVWGGPKIDKISLRMSPMRLSTRTSRGFVPLITPAFSTMLLILTPGRSAISSINAAFFTM